MSTSSSILQCPNCDETFWKGLDFEKHVMLMHPDFMTSTFGTSGLDGYLNFPKDHPQLLSHQIYDAKSFFKKKVNLQNEDLWEPLLFSLVMSRVPIVLQSFMQFCNDGETFTVKEVTKLSHLESVAGEFQEYVNVRNQTDPNNSYTFSTASEQLTGGLHLSDFLHLHHANDQGKSDACQMVIHRTSNEDVSSAMTPSQQQSSSSTSSSSSSSSSTRRSKRRSPSISYPTTITTTTTKVSKMFIPVDREEDQFFYCNDVSFVPLDLRLRLNQIAGPRFRNNPYSGKEFAKNILVNLPSRRSATVKENDIFLYLGEPKTWAPMHMDPSNCI